MDTIQLKKIIEDSILVKKTIMEDNSFLDRIDKSVEAMVKAYKNNGKVLFCGNGGSAADAQHLAAELSGRFYFDREPLDAEALHVNTSYLTAVANDYSYDVVFERMIKAVGKKGDILVSISTSGNSVNIYKAMQEAKAKGMINIALTGETGGKIKELADILLNVPSKVTPRIQESHIMIGHIICEQVEKQLFAKNE
jgi:D-sedoheptulose 7-phosphate isomerase